MVLQGSAVRAVVPYTIAFGCFDTFDVFTFRENWDLLSTFSTFPQLFTCWMFFESIITLQLRELEFSKMFAKLTFHLKVGCSV